MRTFRHPTRLLRWNSWNKRVLNKKKDNKKTAHVTRHGTVNTPHATGRSTRLSPMEDDALAMRAKTPPPRGEDKAMKAKSPPRWGVGSGSSVATGAGQRGGVCPPLGTPAPVRSHCLCCPDGRGGQGHEGQVPIPGAYLKKKLKKKNLRFLASRSYSGVPALADFDRYCQNRQGVGPLRMSVKPRTSRT